MVKSYNKYKLQNDTSEEALITLNEDTADGSVTFRVYDSETLSMSYGKTVTYKLDTTAPTGTVTVEETSNVDELAKYILGADGDSKDGILAKQLGQ